MPDTQRPVLPGFDPFSQEFLADPAAVLRRAQDEEPVFYFPELNYWVVTRFDDVERVISDFETFSSVAIAVLPVPQDMHDRVPPDFYERSFIASDPPVHTISRKAANTAFKRSRVDHMEEEIRGLCNELIDGFAARGSADLMEEFAYPLAIRTLARLIGLPDGPQDVAEYQRWAPDLVAVLTPKFPPLPDGSPAPATPMEPAELRERYERIATARAFFQRLVDEREREPKQDLLSSMLHAEGDEEGGRALPQALVITHMVELITAGSATTANLIGHALKFLGETPGALAALAADPSLVDNAVEEALRRRASTFGIFRKATRDVEIRGVMIPEGSLIWAAYAATGHDPDRFTDSERFDIHRPNAGQHLNFGKGRHFCMGAPLARLESATAVRTLLERLPDLDVPAGQEVEYAPSLIVPELLHLEGRWSAA
ncbi:unannotated protein [freshwater metagenome]|uniref:Unannotated protein n=1 Tax=freshwater metagenome TaxID=449393 RepID=A0A6J7HV82_9ZZZZ|nr:cytochrome P450 [Actinomycetota bacterium]